MALYVKSDDLRAVAASLKQKEQAINNVYNNEIKTLLEESKDAIKVAGVDFNEISIQFKNAFTSLATNLDSLSNALTNQILPKYDNLSVSIKNSFNNNFASQMNDILKRLNK